MKNKVATVSTLSGAIELSENILHAIDQNDWARVSQLETERLEVIDSYYRGADPVDGSLTLELKQLNDQIVRQLIDLQQQTRSQQLELSRSSKASRAYQENMPV